MIDSLQTRTRTKRSGSRATLLSEIHSTTGGTDGKAHMERNSRSLSASGSSLHNLNQRVCRESYINARPHHGAGSSARLHATEHKHRPRTANPSTFGLVPAIGHWRINDPFTRRTFFWDGECTRRWARSFFRMANSEEGDVGEATWLYFAPRYLMITSRPSAIALSELTVVFDEARAWQTT